MFRIAELLSEIKSAPFRFEGDKHVEISGVLPFKDSIGKSNPHSFTWVNEKNASSFSGKIEVGLLILNEQSYKSLSGQRCNFIVTEHPRLLFLEILQLKFGQKRAERTENSARINEDARIGKGTYIGHQVVIEEGVSIGDNCEILHNTVILKDTQIGDNVRIGANCTIGNFGFGYEKDLNGDYILIEHLGNVIIRNNVHIHNNTCIDRAVLGSTIIDENVKIDNLVHIAHGVHIRKNSLIIANAMIAGSTVIGENCWIAPSVSIKNQLEIAADTMTGIGAVILKNTEPGSTVIGNPAESMEEYRKWSAIKKNLKDDKNL